MKNKILNIMARLILLFILLATVGATLLFVLPYLPEPTYAVENTSFDNSNVLDDLLDPKTTIGDGQFDLNKYPADSTARGAKLMNFVEYCYSFRRSVQSHYGIYLYIYNPLKTDIDETSAQNKVQLAVSYNADGTPSNYEKFDLQFCSKSVAPGYANLFYKYKIVDRKSANNEFIFDRINKSPTARRYDISGFELLTKGSSTAIDYKVGGTYIFSGYAKGCGADSSAESSLTSVVNNLETVQLDVQSTFYRTTNSELGEGHQNQLNSVYFGVDNRIINEYGKLQQITAEWYEYKTSPIIVTASNEIYSAYNPYIGVDIGEKNDNIPYGLGVSDALTSSMIYCICNWSYNIREWGNSFINKGVGSLDKCSQLAYLFSTNGKDIKKYHVSSQTLKEYIRGYNKSYLKGRIPEVGKNISADLFSEDVDLGCTRGYNIETFDSDNDFNMLLTYNQNDLDRFFTKWFGKKLTGDFATVKPIVEVKPEHYRLASSDFSNEMFVDENDVYDLKKYYEDNTKATTDYPEGQTMFLFRTALRDYYAAYLLCYENDKLSNLSYMAQETVLLNYDILFLTFNKDGVHTVIAAVANPIDIIPSVSPPVIINNTNWLMVILGLVVMVLVLIVFAPLLKPLIKLVGSVISAPFRRNKK